MMLRAASLSALLVLGVIATEGFFGGSMILWPLVLMALIDAQQNALRTIILLLPVCIAFIALGGGTPLAIGAALLTAALLDETLLASIAGSPLIDGVGKLATALAASVVFCLFSGATQPVAVILTTLLAIGFLQVSRFLLRECYLLIQRRRVEAL